MMQLSAGAEDYLERLYMREVEEAEAEPAPADDRVPAELLRHGYIRQAGDRVALTTTGMSQAERAVRRHRLAERLLHDVIDVQGSQIDQAACEFEHSLHHGIDDHICTLLGHPRTCPHGRPIPLGRCCRDRETHAGQAIATLADLKAGEKGVIAYLSSRQLDTVQKLMALGALPGAPIAVVQTFPSVVFQVEQTQIAVEKTLAADIFIRRERMESAPAR